MSKTDKKYVTGRDLLEILKRHDDERSPMFHNELDDDISVILSLPSIGPRANSKVIHASFGFDWDRGLQFTTEAKLVPKNDKQSIYESAYELICYLATKPVKKQSYEQRTALHILERYGYTKDKLEQIQRVYHKEYKPAATDNGKGVEE